MNHTSSNISKATVAAVNAGTKADAKPRKSGRILAIDVMRGITVAGMILVNNSGGPGTYTPLEHSSWNGLTPTDLVFPFFMFIMGISTFISLRKFDFRLSAPLAWKILKRTVLIFAIGMGLAWLSLFAKGLIVEGKTLWEATMHFGDIRILGVLPRLAICYGIGSLLAVTLRHRWLPIVIVVTLVLYGIMLLVANGYAPDETNILSIADRAVLTDAHMYYTKVDGVRIPIDPEGVLSTIPSIMHVMIGFWCGRLIMEIRDNRDRALRLLLVGFVLTLCGWLLSYGLPINKHGLGPARLPRLGHRHTRHARPLDALLRGVRRQPALPLRPGLGGGNIHGAEMLPRRRCPRRGLQRQELAILLRIAAAYWQRFAFGLPLRHSVRALQLALRPSALPQENLYQDLI